jgi:hypothetical protein
MFKKILLASAFVTCGAQAQISDVPIMGNVASKCVITTDTPGYYGNPVSNLLSTNPADGGVMPIVRYDIIEADSYKAQISWPREFTTSPVLNDVVAWGGSVELEEVSDVAMADFETNKIEWDNVTEFDLTVAGSAWFKISSIANYGFDKSFPGGTYRASVLAECIAK